MPFDQKMLKGLLEELGAEYRLSGGDEQPEWSWPVAAAAIVEIGASGERVDLRIHHYADCFVEILDGSPHASSLVGHGGMAARTYDAWKPASGFAQPRLEALRRRRKAQQANRATTALTLNPVSAMNSGIVWRSVTRPAHVLLGSDGLSRLWDTYGAMTREQAIALAAEGGAAALLERLRAFEASNPTGSATLKRRDDACGLHLSMA
jgi:hypothetical protein